MEKTKLPFEINNYSYNDKNIRYLFYQNEDAIKPLVAIIHGAPGSSDTYNFFLENKEWRSKYSLLVIDRLGYGYSDYGKYAGIKEQTASIIELIKTKITKDQYAYVVGHSYGATIAGTIAIEKPDFLRASVMLAPALDPEQERYFWFGKLGKWKLTRWMAPKPLKVAADEKYNHEKELVPYLDLWKKISIPILHVHGDKDNVVPYGNLDFSKKNIDSKYLTPMTLQGKNHFFPFKEKELLFNILNEYFDKFEK
jgi:uncharacterized protein